MPLSIPMTPTPMIGPASHAGSQQAQSAALREALVERKSAALPIDANAVTQTAETAATGPNAPAASPPGETQRTPDTGVINAQLAAQWRMSAAPRGEGTQEAPPPGDPGDPSRGSAAGQAPSAEVGAIRQRLMQAMENTAPANAAGSRGSLSLVA